MEFWYIPQGDIGIMIEPIMNVFSGELIIPSNDCLSINISSQRMKRIFRELDVVMYFPWYMVINKKLKYIFWGDSITCAFISMNYIVPSQYGG